MAWPRLEALLAKLAQELEAGDNQQQQLTRPTLNTIQAIVAVTDEEDGDLNQAQKSVAKQKLEELLLNRALNWANNPADGSEHQLCVLSLLKWALLSKPVSSDDKAANSHQSFRNLCLRLLRHDRAPAKNRARAARTLSDLAEKFPGMENATLFQLEKWLEAYFTILAQPSKSRPTVRAEVVASLGTVCKVYAELIVHRKDLVISTMLKMMTTEMGSTVKEPDSTILLGCVKGLDGYLGAFGFDDGDEEEKEKVYDMLLRLCIFPEDTGSRRLERREAVLVFGNHLELFDAFLVGDRNVWYSKVLIHWAFSKNRDDHKVGWPALLKYLRVAGKKLAGASDREKALQFFLGQFKELLERPDATIKHHTLSIQGYGFMARALESADQLEVLLRELSRKAESIFLSSGAQDEEGNLFLHSYIESLGNFIVENTSAVPPNIGQVFERLCVLLVSRSPQLPKQYLPFAADSLVKAIAACSGKISADFLNNIAYFSVLESCSNPVVTKAEEELFLTGAAEKSASSVRDYFPFWRYLLQQDEAVARALFDAVVASALTILDKLDLSVREQDEVAVASKTKDFTILTNLIELLKHVCSCVPKGYFGSWARPFGLKVIAHSVSYPNVSGFNRLFSLTLSLLSPQVEEDTKRVFCAHLDDVFSRFACLDPELLHSALELALSMPHTWLNLMGRALSQPLQYIFASGQPDVALVDRAIDLLSKWHQLDSDCRDLRDLLKSVMASLKNLIQVCRTETYDSGLRERQLKARGGGGSKQRRRANIRGAEAPSSTSSPLELVQTKLLLFLGSLELDILLETIPSREEVGSQFASIGREHMLPFALPMPDCRPEIQLDDLLPRLIALSLNSVHRKTQVSAAECLHTLILFVIGKNAAKSRELDRQKPMSTLFERLFPVMLRLGSSQDTVIQELFHTLNCQCICWFTKDRDADSAPETLLLLDAIFESLCAPHDGLLRKRAAFYLSEFLRWSIKQTPREKMGGRAHNPKAVFDRLMALWLHPDAHRRLAGGVAFNRLYRVFREEEALVDLFALSVFVTAIKSIAISQDHGEQELSCVEEAKRSVGHVVRILKQKRPLLSAVNAERHQATGVLVHSLDDALSWCVSLVDHDHAAVRRAAMELVHDLCESGQQKARLFRKFIGAQSSAQYLEKLFSARESPDAASASSSECALFLRRQVGKLETLAFVAFSGVDSGVDLGALSAVSESIGSAIAFCLALSGREFDTPRALHNIRRQNCTLIVRIFAFLKTALGRASGLARIARASRFRELLLLCLFKPFSLGFTVKDIVGQDSGGNERAAQGLKPLLVGLLATLRKLALCKEETLCPLEDVSLPTIVEHCLNGSVVEAHVSQLAGFETLAEVKLLSSSDDVRPEEVISRVLSSPAASASPLKEQCTVTLVRVMMLMSRRLTQIYELVKLFNRRPELAAKIPRGLDAVVFQFILENPSSLIRKLLEDCGEDASAQERALATLIKLCRHLRQNPVSEGGAARKYDEVVATILKHWEDVFAKYPLPLDVLILAQLMSGVRPAASAHMFQSASFSAWFQGQFSHPTLTLADKTKFLDLLPPFLLSSHSTERDVVKFLRRVVAAFPSDSSRLDPESALVGDYRRAVAALLACLEQCPQSKPLLECLIGIACVDSAIRPLISFNPAGWSAPEQAQVAKDVFAMYEGDRNVNTPERKLILLDHFLTPLIASARKVALIAFFKASGTSLLDALSANLQGDASTRATTLAFRIGACNLFAQMYSCLHKDLVHSVSSEIAKELYPYLTDRGLTKSKSFTGKELSQYLVQKFTSVRAEMIDGSKELLELFRKFQCAAYNAVMAIITSIQNEERFYVKFLFSENASKSEWIWERIVDLDTRLDFPLEVTEFTARREKATTIRKTIVESKKDGNAPDFLPTLATGGHFLSDSSLSLDVATFDFHQSLRASADSQDRTSTSRPEEPGDEDSASSMVQLSMDDVLNQHDNMAQLISLLDFMTANGIYKVPGEGEKADVPEWMDALRLKLSTQSVHRNIKFFLLKLIVNCNQVFQPYARAFLPLILDLVVDPYLWETATPLNSLRLDLITMTLSWAEVYVPGLEGRSGEKFALDKLLEILTDFCHAEQASREAVKYLSEVIKAMLQLWRQSFSSESRALARMLLKVSAGERNIHRLLSTLQVLGHFLSSQLMPSASLELWRDVVSLLSHESKPVRVRAAETVGMALAVAKNSDARDFLGALREQVEERLRTVRRKSGQATFVDTLYACHRHYPEIVENVYSHFAYGLNELSGEEQLTHSLTMLKVAGPSRLRETKTHLIQAELNTLNIKSHLFDLNPKNKIAAVDFLRVILPHVVDSETLLDYVRAVEELLKSPWALVRRACFEFYVTLFDEKVAQGLDLSNVVLQEIFRHISVGFDDDDEGVQSLILHALSRSPLLKASSHERAVGLLGLIPQLESQRDYLRVVSVLILSLTDASPELSRILFPDPLSADVSFRDLPIDTSWRSKDQMSLKPRFVETLTSASQADVSSQGSQARGGYVRATQASLVFAPTQAEGGGTLQIFSQNTTAGRGARLYGGATHRTNHPEVAGGESRAKAAESQQTSLLIGKRFLKASDAAAINSDVKFEKTKAYYAQRHAKKEEKSQRILEDQRGRRHAQVELVRRYRQGELPDISISIGEVVKCLRILCSRDDALSSIFVLRMYEALARVSSNDTFIARVRENTSLALKNTSLTDKTLGRLLLDLSARFPSPNLSKESLVQAARKLNVEESAILALEAHYLRSESDLLATSGPASKRRKRPDQPQLNAEAWANLYQLYTSIQDGEGMRGLKLQFAPVDSQLYLGAEDEARGHAELACEKYGDLLKTLGSDEAQYERKLVRECYFDSLQQLSRWEDLHDHIKEREIGNDAKKLFEAGDEALMKRYFAACTHTLAEKPAKANGAFDLVKEAESVEANRSLIQQFFGLDLALLYVSKDRVADAQICHKHSLKAFMHEWSGSSFCSLASATDLLMQLKRLAQMDSFFRAVLENNAAWLQQSRLTETTLERAYNLQQTDQLLADHLICSRAYQRRFSRSIRELDLGLRRAVGLHSFCRESLARSNYPTAIQKLELSFPDVQRVRDEGLDQSYEFLMAEIRILKAEKATYLTFTKRFNALYRTFMDVDSPSARTATRNTKTRVLGALDTLLLEYDQLRGQSRRPRVEELVSELSKQDKRDHFYSAFPLSQRDGGVDKLRSELLEQLINAFRERAERGPNDLFLLSQHFYELWALSRSPDVARSLVEAHVEAAVAGSLEAVEEFPNVFDVLKEFSEGSAVTSAFRAGMRRLETWRLLPWTNQLLAALSNPDLCHALLPYVGRVAADYPAALQYSFNVSAATLPEVVARRLTPALAFDALTAKVVQGLNNVAFPAVKVSDFCANQMKDGLQNLAEEYKQLLEDFSAANGCGDLYRLTLKRLNLDSATRLSSSFLTKLNDSARAMPKGKHLSLASFSPFLSSFHAADLGHFEIPGQYRGYQKPDPSRHVRVFAFHSRVHVFNSLRKPVKIAMVGDNGRAYDFIVKFGEDLRQDERIQQLFGIANAIFAKQRNSELRIPCYQVLPLSVNLGLIECLNNTVSYKDLAMSSPSRSFVGGVAQPSQFMQLLKHSSSQRTRQFEQAVALSDSSTLRTSLQSMSTTSDGFYFYRNNFLRSHALHSVVGWLISLGDRHAENLLVSLKTGHSIPIDFGYAFGATAFLPIPELPPFRLTPQIQELAQPFVRNGPIREIMITALNSIRNRPGSFLSALKVFIQEPTMDWLKLARAAAKRKGVDENLGAESFASNKIEIVREKLFGKHPVASILKELEHGFNDTKVKQLPLIKQLLLGKKEDSNNENDHAILRRNGALRRKLYDAERNLTVEEQVDCLLELATDPNILACCFNGWKAWL